MLSLRNDLNRELIMRRLGRCVSYLAIVIVVVQLLGMGFHRHDITEEHPDCVSCYLAAHLPPGTPPIAVNPAPIQAILFYQVWAAPLYVFIPQQSYLIPHSQAPPPAASQS